jgi:hypothetical protein
MANRERLRLSVKGKDSDPNNESSFPILAELDAFEDWRA